MTGLLITYIALNLMDGHGQPALLYIVPFTLGNFYNPIKGESTLCFLFTWWLIAHCYFDAGTFLALGKKRGDLKILWTRGEPERVCPHVRLESTQESL